MACVAVFDAGLAEGGCVARAVLVAEEFAVADFDGAGNGGREAGEEVGELIEEGVDASGEVRGAEVHGWELEEDDSQFLCETLGGGGEDLVARPGDVEELGVGFAGLWWARDFAVGFDEEAEVRWDARGESGEVFGGHGAVEGAVETHAAEEGMRGVGGEAFEDERVGGVLAVVDDIFPGGEGPGAGAETDGGGEFFGEGLEGEGVGREGNLRGVKVREEGWLGVVLGFAGGHGKKCVLWIFRGIKRRSYAENVTRLSCLLRLLSLGR